MVYQIGLVEILSFFFEGVVCAILLSIIIVFIARIKKELKGAFYHLVLAVFLSDFTFTSFHMTFFLKMPRYGVLVDMYKQNQWLGNFAYNGTTLYTVVQYIGQTLIAFNRFTSIWLPFYHKKIWESKWYVYVLIIFPIICIAYKIPAQGVYAFKDDGTVEIGLADKVYERQALFVMSIVYGTNAGISALLSVLTVGKYLTMKLSALPVDASVKLLIYSLILLVIQLLRFSYSQLRSVFAFNVVVVAILETALSYIVDIHALIASFSILLLSSATRQTYVQFYFSGCGNFLQKFPCKKKTGPFFERTVSSQI